jgi:hypothetical protein
MSVLKINGLAVGANGEGEPGWAYNSVDGWYDVEQDELDGDARPGQDGMFAPDESYASSSAISVEGVFSGSSAQEVVAAKLLLRSLKNRGRMVLAEWEDHGVTTRRLVFVQRSKPRHSAGRNGFKWSIDMLATDPTLYGPLLVAGPVGPPARGIGGLRFDQYTGITYAWQAAAHASASYMRNPDGTTARTNLVMNPRLALSAAGWDFYGPGGTGSPSRNANAPVFAKPAITMPRQSGSVTIAQMLNIPVEAGKAYVLSANIYNVVSGNETTIDAAYYAADGSVTLGIPRTVGRALGLSRINSASVVAPAGTATIGIRVYRDSGTDGDTYATEFMVEPGADALSYFDGGYVGTGVGPGLIFPETYGTEGSSGRLTLVNEGGADSYPLFKFVGGSSLGFTITRVSTGQLIEVRREIPQNSLVTVNPRTGQVTIDGDNDISGSLRRAEWWATAARSTEQVQLGILGSIYGSPTLSAEYSRAD